MSEKHVKVEADTTASPMDEAVFKIIFLLPLSVFSVTDDDSNR